MGKAKPNLPDQREWEFRRLIKTVSKGLHEIDDSPNFSKEESKVIYHHMIEALSKSALALGLEVKGGIKDE